MLRPQDTATRERKNLDGHLVVPARPGGAGRDARWFARPLTGRPGHGRPGQLQRPRPPTPPSATTSVTSGTSAPCGSRAAGTASASSCTSSRPPTAPPCGSTTHEVVSHEGGYTPFEADITELRDRRAGGPVTAVVNNTLSFQSIPPGRHRGQPQRPPAALLARLLQLRRACTARCGCQPPPRPASNDVTVVTGLDGSDRVGRLDRRGRRTSRRARRPRVLCATPTAPRSPPAPGRGRRSTVPDVHLWAPGDGYLYDLEVAARRRRRRRATTRSTRPSASAPSRSAARSS